MSGKALWVTILGRPNAQITEAQFNSISFHLIQVIKVTPPIKQGTSIDLYFSLHSSWILNWLKHYRVNTAGPPPHLRIEDQHYEFRIIYSPMTFNFDSIMECRYIKNKTLWHNNYSLIIIIIIIIKLIIIIIKVKYVPSNILNFIFSISKYLI